MSARILNALGILSSDVPTGNLLWVDAVNGVDALATRGRMTIPFKTLTAAKNAAAGGDTIVVLPGTYNENKLLKNGVNWHFFPGAKVSYTGGDGAGIFDTSSIGTNSAVTSMITGWGDFEVHNSFSTGHVVYSAASASDLVIHAKRMFADPATCVKTANAAGKLKIHVAEDIIASSGKAVEIGGTAGSSNENVIRAHKIRSSAGAGLYVTGGNADVAAQTISASVDSAVNIQGGSGSNIVIRAYEIVTESTYGVRYHASTNPVLTIIGARIVSTYNDPAGHSMYISSGGSNYIKLASCMMLSTHASSKSIEAVSASTTVQLHGLSIGQRVKSANVIFVPSSAWIDTVAVS